MEKDLAEERKKIEPELPDIMTWLLRAYNEVPEKTPKINLDMYGDSQLIITAGSDTTAAALAAIFCELASAPDQIAKLRDELVGHTENFRDVALGLRGLPHLDAVINEALRLHPPVPSGAQRMTPPQGLKIGHVNVPGNTMVQIPHHAMFRDERCWVRPNEFIPERWTNQPELFIDGSVYIPFLIGKHACAGRSLALMELRQVVMNLITKFHIAFADKDAAARFLAGKRDTFTLMCRELYLQITARI